MKIVFNSSLPRSGSTLLQSILAQNPRFHCSPTSGLIELLYAARQNFTTLDEFKLQPQQEMKRAWLGFCRSGLDGFYESTGKPVAVDKSRGWIHYLEWLNAFYPDAKVIVCVRDLRAIISSMEKLHRKNAHLHDPMENPAKMENLTVIQRTKHWFSNPPVGLALNRLSDVLHRGPGSQLHFVRYEDLVENPAATLPAIYDYIGEELFPHEFSSIAQLLSENDALHGRYGDHQIHSDLKSRNGDWNEVLGSQLSNAIVVANKWFYDRFYPGVVAKTE
jgi:sulfotransferase